MNQKGISSLVIVVIIVVAIVVVGGIFYMVSKGGDGAQGLRASDLEPKIGDKWQFKITRENGVSMLMNLEAKRLENRVLGESIHEVYVMDASASLENWGSLLSSLPEGVFIVSSNVSINAYQGVDEISNEMITDFALVFTYSGSTFNLEIRTENLFELLSGGFPDTIRVGDTWSTTQREKDNTIETINGVGTPQSSEAILTMDYECTGTQNVTVQAGTFYCYVIRQTVVGVEGYSLYYYSSKTKKPVKSVEYRNGNITEQIELLSYDVQ
jgi:hypothetical protein